MKIKNYPYGKATKTLKNAVNWLNRNKSKLIKKQMEQPKEFTHLYFNREFDYPDYWDMPKKISYRLNSDEVDWIQDELGEWFRNMEV